MLHANEGQMLSINLLGHLILNMETLKAICYTIKKKADAFDTMILSKDIAKDLIARLTPIYMKLSSGDARKL